MTNPIASTCAYFPQRYCKYVKGTIDEVKDTLKLYRAFRSICVSSIREFKCWVFSLIISMMKYRNHKEKPQSLKQWPLTPGSQLCETEQRG